MKTGLYFGSFNPIHIGHLIIGNNIRENAGLDEVWFVISPHNPHKKSKSLVHEFDRRDMVEAAIEGNMHFKACDIEFQLPKPSFTIHTLAHLREKYQQHHFSLLLGEDNLLQFHRWKNSRQILDNYGLFVYPRPFRMPDLKEKIPAEVLNHTNLKMVEAPILDISATYIRKRVQARKSIKYLVPDKVADLIYSRKLYD